MDHKDNISWSYESANTDLIKKLLQKEIVTAAYHENIAFLQGLYWKKIFSNLQWENNSPENTKEQYGENKFEAYLTSTLSHKKYEQHQEIDERLEAIKEYRNAWKQRGLCVLIQKVLKEFKNTISFDTTIALYFILVENYIVLDPPMPKDALIILNSIQRHEKYLSKEQQQRLWFFLAETYYLLRWKTKRQEHLIATLKYVIRPIDYRNFNRSECEDLFMIEVRIYWESKKYDLCLLAIQEYFATFAHNTTDNNIDILASMLFMQWTIYVEKKQDNDAINSFREYLKYKPDDEEAKQYIRHLSEQEPE